jgi:hypothetical protein
LDWTQPISQPVKVAIGFADASQQQSQPESVAFAVVGVGTVAVQIAVAFDVGLAAAFAHPVAALRVEEPVEQPVEQSLEQDAAFCSIDVAEPQLALRIVAIARMGPPAQPPLFVGCFVVFGGRVAHIGFGGCALVGFNGFGF